MFDQIKDASLQAVSALLAFFYDLPVVGGSYGLSIILLTVSVMIVLMPLTLKATRSTIKMTLIQPELRALQKKHKGDRQALNEEMMALYQKHGVNPVGGCLPMLAQLPVFLLLFSVLRGLSRRVSSLPYYTISQKAQELATGVAPDPEKGDFFEPENLSHSSQLYQDLTEHKEIGFLPGNIFDLSARSWDVLQDNVVESLPYLLLILFVVGTSYYQQRQISARRGAVPENPTPQQQTQQQLLRILPLMSGIWSFLFPAGLVLYWATSNVFRIAQQAYITRALYSEDGEGAQAMAAMAAAQNDDDDDDDDDDGATRSDDDIVSDGRAGRGRKPRSGGDRAGAGSGAASRNGSGRSGAKSGSGEEPGSANGAGPADRNEAWARRRAERARTKTTKKPSGSSGGGSRVTPKGTKPTDGRKKRKR